MQNNGDWNQSPTWPPPDAGYYPIPPRTSSQSRSTSNTSSHNPYSSFQNPYAESSRQPQYDPYQDPWVSAQDAYLSQQVPQALGFQFKNPVLTDPKPLSGTSPAPQPLLQPAPGFERLPAPPSFLVINLFTLRLAFKLIQGLDYYAERVEDLNWIAKFLEIYHPGYDLAKLTGERWRRYLAEYPDIVRRMKRQKSYPKIFMALHPGTPECREMIRKRGGMTDNDRIEIANFVEAAHEWGSTVLVPKSEFGRMKVLTSGRLVADDKREPTDLDPRRAPPREPDPSLKEIVNNPGLYHV